MDRKEKRAHVARLLDVYGDRLDPATASSTRNALNAGEWAHALVKIANALVKYEIPMASDDAAVTKHLLSIIHLSPDAPPNLADRIRVIDGDGS